MGHPARIMEALRHVTLDALEEDHPSKDEIRRMNEDRHRLLNQLRRREDRRRTTTASDRHEMRLMIENLGKQARDQEFALRRQIIQQAQVVLQLQRPGQS